MWQRSRPHYYEHRDVSVCICDERMSMIECYLPEPWKSDCSMAGSPLTNRLIRGYLHHHLFRWYGWQRRRLCDQCNKQARPVQPSGAASWAVQQACLFLACVPRIQTKGSLAQAGSVSTLRSSRKEGLFDFYGHEVILCARMCFPRPSCTKCRKLICSLAAYIILHFSAFSRTLL